MALPALYSGNKKGGTIIASCRLIHQFYRGYTKLGKCLLRDIHQAGTAVAD
jgi:hypothetical protein